MATDAPMTESRSSTTATQPTLQPTTAKRRWGWGQWAAAILLPLCIGLLGYNLLQGRMNHISTLIVQADRGDKATVVLPDGTSVILNSSSQLDYYSDFGRKERRVKLEGEGYFDVSRDEAHAFVVQVGELEVKVLGTIFNVSAYSDANEVSVVLLEGKVEVCTPNTNNIMQPNERLTYNRETNKITTQKVYGTDYVTWTKGNLYFENETLQNIMQTLSRKYDVNIYIDSSAIVNDRFTGTIPDGGIQNALNILKWTSSFDYELKDSVIVIREK